MKYLPFLIPSILLALGAVWLAYNGINGWGWLLFGAIILFPTIKSDSDDE